MYTRHSLQHMLLLHFDNNLNMIQSPLRERQIHQITQWRTAYFPKHPVHELCDALGVAFITTSSAGRIEVSMKMSKPSLRWKSSRSLITATSDSAQKKLEWSWQTAALHILRSGTTGYTCVLSLIYTSVRLYRGESLVIWAQTWSQQPSRQHLRSGVSHTIWLSTVTEVHSTFPKPLRSFCKNAASNSPAPQQQGHWTTLYPKLFSPRSSERGLIAENTHQSNTFVETSGNIFGSTMRCAHTKL